MKEKKTKQSKLSKSCISLVQYSVPITSMVSATPDDDIPCEGLVLLLLDLQLRCLKAQGFPGLCLLGAAITQAAPALLHLGRQTPTAALHWIVAAHGTNGNRKNRN